RVTIFKISVQSTSDTVGVLQGLYAEGAVTLEAALPVLFGDNIGTTITAVIAALGVSVAARRAAFTHVIFNLVGSVLFLILLNFFVAYVSFLQDAFHLNPEMTFAFAHGSRSEEHTSELQSRFDLVCRLLLEKINNRKNHTTN